MRQLSHERLDDYQKSTGRTSRADNRRHFAIARGSALECGAVLDACRILELADKSALDQGKERLVSIVSMLSKLSQSQRDSMTITSKLEV